MVGLCLPNPVRSGRMTANPDRTLLSAYRESPAGKEECSVRIGDKPGVGHISNREVLNEHPSSRY
jgi:hypothetical protein